MAFPAKIFTNIKWETATPHANLLHGISRKVEQEMWKGQHMQIYYTEFHEKSNNKCEK
jgi:hypothetical protein